MGTVRFPKGSAVRRFPVGTRARSAALALVVSSAALVGCSDSHAATTANFETAARAEFAKHDQRMCVTPFRAPMPFKTSFRSDMLAGDFNDPNNPPEDDGTQGLIDAGLIAVSHPPDVHQPAPFQSAESHPFTEKYRVYSLTPLGETFAVKDSSGLTELCYGTKVFDAVTNFTSPADAGGVQASQVTYTFHVPNIAAWASNPKIVAAFSAADGWGDRAPEYYSDDSQHSATMTMVQTNNGWEAR